MSWDCIQSSRCLTCQKGLIRLRSKDRRSLSSRRKSRCYRETTDTMPPRNPCGAMMTLSRSIDPFKKGRTEFEEVRDHNSQIRCSRPCFSDHTRAKRYFPIHEASLSEGWVVFEAKEKHTARSPFPFLR